MTLAPDFATLHLIETVRVEPGHRVPLIDLHLARLRRSCAVLGTLWFDGLSQAIAAHIHDLDARASWRLRILLDVHGSHSLQTDRLADTPTPVHVTLAPGVLIADAAWLVHKSTYRPWYAHAAGWLHTHPDVFDVLYCNARDEVCEGSRSNVYVQDSTGHWFTPPLACGLLPGVQRQALLDQGRVQEAVIPRAQLQAAPRMRVSNALRGWMDAVLVDSLFHQG